MSPLRT
jgi:hypothetical protein